VTIETSAALTRCSRGLSQGMEGHGDFAQSIPFSSLPAALGSAIVVAGVEVDISTVIRADALQETSKIGQSNDYGRFVGGEREGRESAVHAHTHTRTEVAGRWDVACFGGGGPISSGAGGGWWAVGTTAVREQVGARNRTVDYRRGD
jgi:hypothetical protein